MSVSVNVLSKYFNEVINYLGMGYLSEICVKDTDKVAAFNVKTHDIIVDPLILKYCDEETIRKIIYHEACHSVERYYAEKKGLDILPEYVEAFNRTKGHTAVFQAFANDVEKHFGVAGIFAVEFEPMNLDMDLRIADLCAGLDVDTKDVICKLDCADVLYDDVENKVIVHPKYFTGDKLDFDSFQDISLELAALKGYETDEDYEFVDNIVDSIWNDMF